MNEVGQWVVENWPWALPLWQWFKVNWDKVVGVISLVLAVIFFLNQRQTEQLDYILSSHHWVYSFPTRLFLSNNRKSVGPTWRLQVDGKEVTEPRLYKITVLNTGKLTLRAADFLRPIRFRGGNPESLTHPVAAWVLTTKRAQLPAEEPLQWQNQLPQVHPEWIAVGGRIELALLFEGNPDGVTAWCTLADKGRLRSRREPRLIASAAVAVGLFLMGAVSGLLELAGAYPRPSSVLLMLITAFLYWRMRKVSLI